MPVDSEPTHIIVPNVSYVIPGGDQCTFFGCYQYCERIHTQCTRTYGDFFEVNVTICKLIFLCMPLFVCVCISEVLELSSSK